ncbi:MAG: hypothetical protein FWD26_07390 [Treponema sp.]|nr:hypothetical protein [Treponema sp.]
MKKLIIVLFFLALISPIFAEESPNMYYVNVSVEKIFPSSQGYIVQYRGQTGIRTIGIPNVWFSEAAGKGDLVRLPTAKDWPTMSVFYNNGEFSHVRLYVSPVKAHQTWGSVPQGTDVSRFFPDGDTFKLQF